MKKPRDFTRLALKVFRKKFYQKRVSLVKLKISSFFQKEKKFGENLCDLVVIKRERKNGTK